MSATTPITRTPITREQAEELYPESTLLFDMQAPHIAQRDDVEFYSVVNKSNRAGTKKLHARTSDSAVRAYFDERVRVWVRYSCGFKSRPYRLPRLYDDEAERALRVDAMLKRFSEAFNSAMLDAHLEDC